MKIIKNQEIKRSKPVNYNKHKNQVTVEQPRPPKTPLKTKEDINRIRIKPQNLDVKFDSFELRYVLVNSRQIINLCSPEYNYKPSNWDNKEELNKRIRIGQKYIWLMNQNMGFYDRLEASILSEGFRNPILLTSGPPKFRSLDEIPPELRSSPKDLLLCEVLGGSRLLIAAKHDLLIPAIVNDYTGAFSHGRLLMNNEDIKGCFTDIPTEILITNRGLRLSPPKHIQLDEKYHDPQTVIVNRRNILRECNG